MKKICQWNKRKISSLSPASRSTVLKQAPPAHQNAALQLTVFHFKCNEIIPTRTKTNTPGKIPRPCSEKTDQTSCFCLSTPQTINWCSFLNWNCNICHVFDASILWVVKENVKNTKCHSCPRSPTASLFPISILFLQHYNYERFKLLCRFSTSPFSQVSEAQTTQKHSNTKLTIENALTL